MDPAEVLRITLRESSLVAQGWTYLWRDFDGRSLRNQTEEIREWAKKALASRIPLDCTVGQEFFKERLTECCEAEENIRARLDEIMKSL